MLGNCSDWMKMECKKKANIRQACLKALGLTKSVRSLYSLPGRASGRRRQSETLRFGENSRALQPFQASNGRHLTANTRDYTESTIASIPFNTKEAGDLTERVKCNRHILPRCMMYHASLMSQQGHVSH